MSTSQPISPLYNLLCFFCDAFNCNYAIHVANILRFLPQGCFLFHQFSSTPGSTSDQSTGNWNPTCVSSAQLLTVGIFIKQWVITLGQGHIVSLRTTCNLSGETRPGDLHLALKHIATDQTSINMAYL